MTAVEWLVDQLFKQGYFDGNKPLSITNLDHLQEQAIQREKQEQDKIYDHAFKYGQLSQLPGIDNSQVIPVNPDMIKEDGKVMALHPFEESKAIPELSDEEIIKWAYGKQYDPNDKNQSSFVEGMKAYRELIKSKQCSATTK